MIELRGEPEILDEGRGLVGIRLGFSGLPEAGVAATGVRRGGCETISQGLAILPGPSVVIDLDYETFKTGAEVLLAVKADGYATPEAPRWEGMNWSWTGRFQASVQEGRPHLEWLP